MGWRRAIALVAGTAAGLLCPPAAAMGQAPVRAQIDLGPYHTCSIRTDGTLKCWGFDEFGKVTPPNNEGGTYTAVSTGSVHTCAIKSDGSLKCWGTLEISGHVTGPNSEGGTYIAVSAGDTDTCALKTGGILKCWGEDFGGKVTSPNLAGGTYIAVTAGQNHTCAIRTDGSLACWGPATDAVAEPNAAGGTYTAVAAGWGHTCAIRSDGHLRCWGFDNQGQVSGPNGDGGTFTAVETDGFRTCAIRTDGGLRCWGAAGLPPSGVDGTYIAVALGANDTCAIKTDGRISCWGADYFGEASQPANEAGTFTRVPVAAGHSHSCAVDGAGRLECWGLDGSGQVSGPNAAGGTFAAVSAGFAHTCALRTDGGLGCWGANNADQTSGPNAAGGTFTAVRAAANHTCAIKSDSTLECWGLDDSGQVSGPNAEGGTFIALSAAPNHTCAIKTGGALECWGDDTFGQVSGANAEGGTFIAVNAAAFHTCAITTAGTLECWGLDAAGQVAGPNAEGGTFTAVSTGANDTCAIKTAGTLECWGSDANGQVAGPNAEGGTFTGVGVGQSHACATKSAGLVECWGNGVQGQLGAAPAVPGPAAAGPAGAAGYSHSFTTGSGTPAGEFAVTAGDPPPGLSLSAAGVLSGTPTQQGSFTFTVTARNLIGSAASEHTILVDLTAPAAAPGTPPDWSDHDVTVAWNWADTGGTGIDTASCTPSSTSSGEGAAIELEAECSDLVGNTGSAARTVKVDKTPPVVACGPAPAHTVGAVPSAPVTATVTDALSGPVAARISSTLTPADLASAGMRSKALTGIDRAGNTTTVLCAFAVTVPDARALTITTRRIVVIKRSTRALPVTCTLDQPRLASCALTLSAGRRTLATARAAAGTDPRSAAATLALDKRTRRLARRPGGLEVSLHATAAQTGGGPPLETTIPLQLLPRAVVSAPSDGMFHTGSARLPRNGTAYLRHLRDLLAGARSITCTGHTDNVGSTAFNERLGRDRAKAVCAFLARGTEIRTRVRSRGETDPRAPNTTAPGRARNRYVSIQVAY